MELTGGRKSWPPILERAAEIVYEFGSATLRQLFYRLVAEQLLANRQTDYSQLSEYTAKRRREGTFPQLIDRTRWIERPVAWASPAEALEALADEYRRDRLEGQAIFPFIVAEKATLVGQLFEWFGEPYGIPIAALRGYASESYERDIMKLVRKERNGVGRRRAVMLLYIGDFDPTGEDIPRAFEDNTGLYLHRVALDWPQVLAYDLPPALGKATDTRAAAFEARHGQLVQVELEALAPPDLRALLQEHVDEILDMPMIERAKERETAEREQLRRLVDEYGSADA